MKKFGHATRHQAPRLLALILCALTLSRVGWSQAPSSVTLVSSPNPAYLGEVVNLTATVTSGATGNVTFYDGTDILGIRPISGTQATLSTVLLPFGSRSLRAYYSGDGTFAPSSSAAGSQAVNAGPSFGLKAPVVYPAGIFPNAIIVSDFNGDLKQDLAVGNGSGATIQILLGNGNGTFQSALAHLNGVIPTSLATADFNADGKTDLASGSFGGVRVALGNGDGTFQAAVAVPTMANPAWVAVGDFNGDGKADLAVAGGNTTGVLLGNGNGTFQTAVNPILIVSSPNTLAVGDMNNDGKADLVAPLPNRFDFALLKGNGDGTLQAAQLFSTSTRAGSVALGDLNGDGKQDVVVFGNGSLSVRPGNGDGTFQNGAGHAAYPDGRSVALGDFNGDGKLDAVAASFGLGGVYIYLGNGDGTLQAAVIAHQETYYTSVAVGDFNGDSKTDVVEAIHYSNSVGVLLGGAIPDLAIAVTHGAGFTQGQTGAIYKLTVSSVGGIATSGAVGVVASLPAGFTATSMGGNGWTCLLATLTCTRSDSLAINAGYPQIAITVNVASGVIGNATASATVSGGGDANNSNNQNSDTAFVRFFTTTTLVSSPNPSLLGQSVNLTATVSSGTGSVEFLDGATVLGIANITGGQAIFSTSGLVPGSHSLTARYTGDPTYGPSTSFVQLQTVNALATNGFRPRAAYAGAPLIAKGDFNRDGQTDLVSNRGQILIGNGDGTFHPNVYGVLESGPTGVIVGDFNEDSKEDFVLLVSNLYLFAGIGDGTFQAGQIAVANSNLLEAMATDLNQDGHLDLIGNFQFATGLGVLLGNGDGTFQSPLIVTTGYFQPGFWVLADFNNDGKPDVATLPGTSTPVSVRLGNGDGTFQSPLSSPNVNTNAMGLSEGDFNADGKRDLLITYWIGAGVLLGNGDGSFQAALQSTFNVSSPPWYLTTPGDFNGDGNQDFAYHGYYSNRIQIVFGNGNGTFQSVSSSVTKDSYPGTTILADFNKDGRPDIAVGNPDSINIYLGGQFSGLSIQLSHTGSLTAGQTKTYQIAVTNPAFLATDGQVTVTDTLPAGLSAVALSGEGWNCTLATKTCTRSDSLNSSNSYPPISLTVLAAANLAPSTLINSASVNWNGVVNVASDPTAIVLSTTTILSVLPNPATLGQAVTMWATPSSGGGFVTFFDGANVLGTAPIVGVQASITTYSLPAGLRQISATYAGDSTHGSGSSAIEALTVNAGQSSGVVPAPVRTTGLGPQNIVTGDFNKDGKADLVTSSVTNTSAISVLLGNGDGTFQANVDYLPGSAAVEVAVADLNSDGFPDLVVATPGAITTSILMNSGTGTFTVTTIPTGQSGLVVAADFNTDGKVDVALSGNSGYLNILPGNGDGTFGLLANVSCCDYRLMAGDFNNDRKPDLLSNYVRLGNGDGSFQQQIWVGLSFEDLAIGDVNRDGKADVVGADGGSGIRVALGNGNGTFQPYLEYSGGTPATGIEIADVNGDGNLDAIAANRYANNIRVWFGAGNGTFPSSITHPTGTSPRSVVSGDFNGDARTDLAIANEQSNNITILLGTLPSILSVTSTHAGNFVVGQIGASYTIVVKNGGPAVTSGTVTVIDTLPAGLTATGISGTGWACVLATLTCTRSDALAVAASYPPITLTVNVAANAPALVTNQVSASGGNSPTANAFDPTTILASIEPLAVSGPASLSAGTIGVAYGAIQLTATGGTGGYIWTAIGLPNGISINAAGVLGGTPAAGSQGIYNPQFTVTDSNSTTAVATRPLTINAALLAITGPASLTAGAVGLAYNSTQFTAVGGTGGNTWSATGLPSGLSINAAGLLFGTLEAGSAGTYNPQFTVRDSSNVTAAVARVLVVNPSPLVIATGPDALRFGTVGVAYLPVQFVATGGTGAKTWSGVDLPNGMTFSATGVLSGTPAAGSQGSYNPIFTVRDSANAASSASYTLLVNTVMAPAPVISSTTLNPLPAISGVQSMIINGSGFQVGPALKVRVAGNGLSGDLKGAQVTFVSSTQLVIWLNVGTKPGNWTAKVSNPDGQESNTFLFSVNVQPMNRTLALPQLAFGGGWYTALYFSNTTGSTLNVPVSFIGDNGTPLSVPLLGIGSVTSRTVTLAPGATVILEAPNAGPLVQGWVEATLPPGVTGYAVFRQSVVGRADQEAVVPLTTETSLMADFSFDDINHVTSLVFLNPTNVPTSAFISVYGSNGAQLAWTQVPLGPRSKVASILKDLPGLAGIAGKRGRVTLSVGTGAISVLGFRFGGEAFTSIPVTHSLEQVTFTTPMALPQLAFGGGWYTAMYFSNTTYNEVSFPVSFVSDTGTPLSVPLLGSGPVTSRTVTLLPGGTLVLEAPNAGSLVQGWAEINLPPGVVVNTVFRQTAAGRVDQEAVVPLTTEFSQSADLSFDDVNFVTSMVFVNPSNEQTTATITIYGADGTQVGSTQTVLPARSKVPTVLKDLPGLSGSAGKRGRIHFSVPNGAISVLGFRFGGEAFTSIPVDHK